MLHLVAECVTFCEIITFYAWCVIFQCKLRISRSFVSIFELKFENILHSL